jgi:hypothetical protein
VSSIGIEKFFTESEDASLLMAYRSGQRIDCLHLDNIDFIQDDFIYKCGHFAGVPAEMLEYIIERKNVLIEDNSLLELLYLSVSYVYSIDDEAKRRRAIPVLEKTVPESYPIFFFLLVLAGVPRAINIYEDNNWPLDILKASLQDINIWSEHNKKEFNIVGLKKHDFGWMLGLLDGKTFRLGRLQFQKQDFVKDITVFRHNETGEVCILCGDGARYNRQGLIDGVSGVWDEDGYWVSEFKMTNDAATGNPVSINGFAENRIVELKLNEWKDILHKDDNTVNIHIPAGEPLTMEACINSLEMAREFFRRYFADYKYKAFVCYSWFLDSQFEDILGSDSNIVKFQHLGRVYPIDGESDTVRRVFGERAKVEGIHVVPHKTKMQRVLAAFSDNGGVFHNGGLVILKEL